MTLDELIKKATELREKHGGDLEVVREDDETLDSLEYNDDPPPVIVLNF